MITTLERVSLIQPLGDMGDRNIQGISTAIKSDTWHLEADVSDNSIRDVQLFRNHNEHSKDLPADWRYHCTVPAANIKAYRLLTAPKPTQIAPLFKYPPPAASIDEPQTSPQAPAIKAVSTQV